MNYQKKVEAISTKGLTKNLMNKCKVLDCAKYCFSGILQNYLVLISSNKDFKFFSSATEIYSQKSKGMSEESIEK